MAPITTVFDAGVTATEATAALETVSADVAVSPSACAMIIVTPADSPTASPVDEIVATPGTLDDQVIGLFVRTLPFASRAMATNCTVPPTETANGAGAIVNV